MFTPVESLSENRILASRGCNRRAPRWAASPHPRGCVCFARLAHDAFARARSDRASFRIGSKVKTIDSGLGLGLFVIPAFIIFLAAGLQIASAQEVRFERITVENGLTTNNINTLTQDSRGYLWIGTNQGLNRYDGYGAKVYRPIPGDSASLSFDAVIRLLEADDGTLWVVTRYGGLDHFDPRTDTFTRYQFWVDEAVGTDQDWQRVVLQSSDGTLWVGTDGGHIYRFDRSTNTFIRLRFDDAFGLDGQSITDLYQTSDGFIWIATTQGLYRFDPRDNTSASGSPPVLTRYLMDTFVFALCQASDGMLWIGTSEGLRRYDLETSMFMAYRHRAGDPGSLSQNSISAVAQMPDGMIWIGTNNAGLNRLNPETGIVTRYSYNEDDPTSLGDDGIKTLYTASDGTLWIGTYSGLHRLDQRTTPFIHYRPRPDDPNSLSSEFMADIYEMPEGMVWISANDGGLQAFDPRTGTFTQHIEQSGLITQERSYFTDYFTALYRRRAGGLWVAGTDQLNHYDPETSVLEPVAADPLDQNRIEVMLETSDGMVWIGTDQGLFRFDSNLSVTEGDPLPSFIKYDYPPDHEAGLSLVRTVALTETRDGSLWLGTEDGLHRFDPATETFTPFLHDEADSTSISHNRVRAIHEARDGTLWLGTGNGLNRAQGDPADPASLSFIRYTAATSNFDGSIVNAILEDDVGMLWLGLMSGKLARFNPETGHYRFFGPSDGINMGTLSRNAIRLISGEMYFLGKGIIVFDPKEIENDAQPPLLYLTDLWLYNQIIKPGPEAVLKAPLSETQEVVLHYDENDISIGFVGINYADPEGTRYNYRLVNYDRGWRGVTEQRQATYTSLPSGHYRFEVKAANSDGVWTEPVTLNVIIQPPWWRTTWAYLFYGMLMIGALFVVDRIQRRRLLARERERVRERELEQARQLEKAHAELQQAHQHLKATQAQLVQQEKLASLGELTAGIAHEIKNPLNFINNFAEMVGEFADELDEEIGSTHDTSGSDNTHHFKEILSDLKLNAEQIAKHGRRADGIVSAMMQHASGGTGQREPTDVNALLEEYVNLAYHGKRAQVEGFTCEIERDYDEAVGKVEMVPQDMGRVFLNLLSNAFDAVSDQVQPTVRVQTQTLNDAIEIRVTDNGPGIPENLREKIYEPFFTTKPTGSGTGLGLSLAHDIVTQGHGGRLDVESGEGKGSTFVVTLPT